jgi:hypothetical protein
MIEGYELTELKVQDCEGFTRLIEGIEDPIEVAIGDGSYDRFSCYEVMKQVGGKGIFPPQRNAATSEETKTKKKKASREAIRKRDEAVERVREIGRKDWKKEVGYHRRSLAETGMFRIKTLLGKRLSARLMKNQQIEAKIWCCIMNKMTALGMPKSEVI